MLHCLTLFTFSLFLILVEDVTSIGYPAKAFSKHRLVTPVVYNARTKREITTTKHTDGIHQTELTINIKIDGKDITLDLKVNKDILASDHMIIYQKDGDTVLHKPGREETDICQYSGNVRDMQQSWVAVSTCHGIRGIIHDGNKTRYIEPKEGSGINSLHYIYDHSDLNLMLPCDNDGTNNTKYEEQKNIMSNLHGEDVKVELETELRGPFNSTQLSRYVEMVLVVDNSEFKANEENITLVLRQMKDITNIVNSIYAQLNVFIALVGVVVWTERNEINLDEDGDKTLTNFLYFRRNRLNYDIPNDAAYLMSRQKFNGGVIGKSLIGTMCTTQYSGGVAIKYSEVIGLFAATLAHQIGHNFGMKHDEDGEAVCLCPDERCIMSRSTGISGTNAPTHWSNCSIDCMIKSFKHGLDYCLRNKPKSLFDPPTCGNGFIEATEQCDCGLSGSSACYACCDTESCMFKSNATCAVGDCCNTQTCQLKQAGKICRSTSSECDLPEYCTGYSEFCPKDVYKMDTTPCSNNQAFCVNGSCRTHENQCKLLWGPTGKMSSELCYEKLNIKGDGHGNCGYKGGNYTVYQECATEDVLCGLLHCEHNSDHLWFGVEAVSVLRVTFLNNNGTIFPCRTAFIDLGLSDVAPGLVPDGAKCGEQKMCLSRKCVPVADIREQIATHNTSICPSDCSGHGVCNSEGHCHCYHGYIPPLCTPSFWGSIDSGPALE